jgi:hypothetical protein
MAMTSERLPNDDSAPKASGNAGSGHMAARVREEIETCRSIAARCAFVLGAGRSGTTVLAQMINSNDKAFMTTEANFHLCASRPDFRAWYNAQHRSFANQIAKCSYAPNFALVGENRWWEWLARAAEHFELVGDKMAFSEYHFQECNGEDLMSFFEARFFSSRYLVIFRDPIQTLLSSAVLWDKEPFSLIAGWALMVQLWADFIRVFPHTMTLILEDLHVGRIPEIGGFLGLDLTQSAPLLDPREQRRHELGDHSGGKMLEEFAPRLEAIFNDIREAAGMSRVLLQADQKRASQGRGPADTGRAPSQIAVVSTPVGRAWNLADQLINELKNRPV